MGHAENGKLVFYEFSNMHSDVKFIYHNQGFQVFWLGESKFSG